MSKKIIILLFAVANMALLSGCGVKNNTENKNVSNTETKSVSSGSCKEEKVTLPNYGDPGKRLKNCFVEYPGEPSRPDKSYYIIEDICGQFTQEFVENALGQKIVKMELPKISGINNCTYYLDDKEYLMFNLEYLTIENQKIGNEAAGFKVEKNSEIPMENLVITQGDGPINVIYLVLSPQKFISIRPASKNTIENEKFLDFAAKVGEAIKKYK